MCTGLWLWSSPAVCLICSLVRLVSAPGSGSGQVQPSVSYAHCSGWCRHLLIPQAGVGICSLLRHVSAANQSQMDFRHFSKKEETLNIGIVLHGLCVKKYQQSAIIIRKYLVSKHTDINYNNMSIQKQIKQRINVCIRV